MGDTPDNPELDVICIGRSSVDLYGSQVGGRLEDMASFAKYIGGSPTNISIGSARLGLKSALITRVGDLHPVGEKIHAPSRCRALWNKKSCGPNAYAFCCSFRHGSPLSD